jgi:competence protein ComEC
MPVLVRPSRPAEFRYGNRLRVTGQLTAPPECATFNYAAYLAQQGGHSLVDRPQVKVLISDQGSPTLAAIDTFRDQAYVVIQQILSKLQASLLSSILLGIDAGFPADVQEDFRVTGTSHIIAISG